MCCPEQCRGRSAQPRLSPGPQLGFTMPTDMPSWLGGKLTFQLSENEKKGLCSDSFCKFYVTTCGSKHHCIWNIIQYYTCHCSQMPITLCLGKKKTRFGSATVRLWLNFVCLGATWIPSRQAFLWSSVNWRWVEFSLFLWALRLSLCCRVQWTLRKHQQICHHCPTTPHPGDKVAWPLLKLQWPKVWTLLLSIPSSTQPLGIYDLKFIRNHSHTVASKAMSVTVILAKYAGSNVGLVQMCNKNYILTNLITAWIYTVDF